MAKAQLAGLGPFEYAFYRQDVEMLGDSLAGTFTPKVTLGGEWSSSVREVRFPLGLDFDQTQSVVFPQAGDLLGECFMRFTLPALPLQGRWVDAVGYALFRTISLVLDGNVLHDDSPRWMELRDRLLSSPEKRGALDSMVGRGVSLALDQEHTLYVPMDWYFCRGVAQKLPVGGMGDSRLSVTVTTQPLATLILPAGGDTVPGIVGVLGDPVLLCTYYLVTEQERLAIMTREQVQLVEQVQETTVENYSIDGVEATKDIRTTLTVQLPFTRPTKCLVWAGNPEDAPPFTCSDCFSDVSLLYGSTQRFEQEPSAHLTRKQAYSQAQYGVVQGVGMYSYCLDIAALPPSGYAELGAVSSPVLRMEMSTTVPTLIWVWALTYNLLRVTGRRASLLLA